MHRRSISGKSWGKKEEEEEGLCGTTRAQDLYDNNRTNNASRMRTETNGGRQARLGNLTCYPRNPTGTTTTATTTRMREREKGKEKAGRIQPKQADSPDTHA